MSQQINLLTRRPTMALAPLAVMLLPAATLLAVAGLWWYGNAVEAKAQAAEARSQRQVVAARAALAAAEAQSAPDPATEVARLQPLAEIARRVVAQANELGSREGYAGFLATLASVPEKDLWLTGVAIANGGKTIAVNGRALRKEAVITYAQRLNAALASRGLQLGALEISAEVADKAAGNGPPAVVFKLQR